MNLELVGSVTIISILLNINMKCYGQELNQLLTSKVTNFITFLTSPKIAKLLTILKTLQGFLISSLQIVLTKLIAKSLKQGNLLLITWEKAEELTVFSSPIDSAEVQSIISDLKKGKSVGPYSIPCNFLKMLNQSISPLLVILINESFLTGIFPDKLNIAEVIALHKKGATDDPSNYRPISCCYLCLVRFLKKSCTKDFITLLKLMMYYIHCNLVSDASIPHNIRYYV